jgi:hypothetical protein
MKINLQILLKEKADSLKLSHLFWEEYFQILD